MANRPLRLKNLLLLYILDLLLTYQGDVENYQQVINSYPPPYSTWVLLRYLGYYFATLLLIALVWVRNKMAYILTLIYLSFEVSMYFIAYPTYPAIFLIIESIQLAILLSLFKYFFS